VDKARALVLMRTSCARGAPRGCSVLGIEWNQGRNVPAPDPQQALTYSLRGCELGDPTGCGTAGVVLGFSNAVTRDYARGSQLPRQACDLDAAFACGALGNLYAQGLGVPKDATCVIAVASGLYGRRG